MSVPEDLRDALDDACPDWVTWLAQDADGCWWGYEVQPLPHDTGWYENEVGRSVRLCRSIPNNNWHGSLLRRAALQSGTDN